MKTISLKPDLVVSRLNLVINGLDKYSAEVTIPNMDVAAVTEIRDDLILAMQKQTEAFGTAESATMQMRESRDAGVDTLRRIRDILYGIYSKYDPKLVEFGFDTLSAKKTIVTTEDTEVAAS